MAGFEDGDLGAWEFYREDLWRVAEEGGNAVLELMAQDELKQHAAAWVSASEQWEDYLIQARVKKVEGDWAGLFLRRGEQGAYYLCFDEQNRLVLRKPGFALLARIEQRCEQDRYHELRVEARGPAIRVWLDGAPVLAVLDEASRRGACGFIGFHARAHFAGVEIKHPLPPIDVGSAKQLFLDDYWLVRSLDKVALTVNPPRKTGEVVLTGDQPWEKYLNYACVVQDNDAIRLYYEDILFDEDIGFLCCAVSKDGIHFQKPTLNLHEYAGSKANNIVMAGSATGGGDILRLHGGSVFKDPAGDPDRRYKFIFVGGGKVCGAYSPDGFTWTHYPEPLIPGFHSDTQNVAFWDASLNCYVAYLRHHTLEHIDPERWRAAVGSGKLRGDQLRRRVVGRAQSQDFEHWGPIEIVLAPDEHDGPAMDFYNNAVLKYPYADNAYLILTSAYHYKPDTLEAHLATSRDGILWTRPSREPFIPNGPLGSIDSKQIFVCPGLVRVGDEIWIYYSTSTLRHSSGHALAKRTGRGKSYSRAVMRLDGYASMDAGEEEGVLTTRPIIFAGDRLELNATTSPMGYIIAEVLDEQGNEIAGFGPSAPFAGDSVAALLSWQDAHGVGSLAGRPVCLRFRMADAKLYAFQFRGGDR